MNKQTFRTNFIQLTRALNTHEQLAKESTERAREARELRLGLVLDFAKDGGDVPETVFNHLSDIEKSIVRAAIGIKKVIDSPEVKGFKTAAKEGLNSVGDTLKELAKKF